MPQHTFLAGISAIGTGLPTFENPSTGGTVSTLLPGFGSDNSIWTFVFQDASNIWAAYTNTTEVYNATTGYYDPAACIGAIAHYTNASGTWELDLGHSPCVDAVHPVYSVSGRLEGPNAPHSGWYVVYATSVAGLFRYNVSANVVVELATPGAHRYFRSVSVAPTPPLTMIPTTVLVFTAGDASTVGTSLKAGQAFPLRADEVDVSTGHVYATYPLPRVATPGGSPACTVGISNTTSYWVQAADGLPSNSADGRFAMLPCFNIPVGSNMTMISSKAVFMLDYYGTISYTAPLYAFQGVGSASGVRQVASADGSTFYLAGASADYWGWRYTPARTARTTFFVQGSAGVSADGYADARGVGIFNNTLYGSAGPTDSGSSLIQVSAGAALPTSDANDASLLIPASEAWSFVFENATSLWLSVDGGAGAHGSVVHYTQAGGSWALAGTVVLDTNYPVYSIAGRQESSPSGFFVYAASEIAAYRYNTASATSTIIQTANVAGGEYIRGVAFPAHA